VDAVREAGFPKPRIEGEENGEWIIVDCGAAVAHVMQPAIRQYYHLEEIWGDKPLRLRLGAPKPVAPEGRPAAKKALQPPSLRRSSAAKTAEKAAKREADAAKKTPAKKSAKPAGKTASRPAGKSAGGSAGKSARPKSSPARGAAGKSAPARKPAGKTPARKAPSKSPSRKA
jgi:ribosome-associated protein